MTWRTHLFFVGVLAAWPTAVSAQDDVDTTAWEDSRASDDDRLTRTHSRCGDVLVLDGVVVADEHDGHRFRGIGSPGRGTQLRSSFVGSTVPSGTHDGGAALILGVDTTLLRLGRRTCITTQLDVPVPFGSVGDWATGNVVAGFGLLVRHPRDRVRVGLGLDIAIPALAPGERTPNSLAAGFGYALAAGVDEDLQWLPALRWGGLVWGRVEGVVPFGRSGGVSVDLLVRAGYARMASVVDEVEGLVGGARLTALFQNRAVESVSELGYGLGVRVRVGIGSLWPTDILLPLQWAGVGQVAYRDVLVELSLGMTHPQHALGNESYFTSRLSVSLAFDEAFALYPEDPTIEQ